MLKRLIKALRRPTDQEYIEQYLADSENLIELELRMKELQKRGYLA